MCRHSREVLLYGNNKKLAIDNLDFVRNSIAYFWSNKFYNLTPFSRVLYTLYVFLIIRGKACGFAFKGRYY